MTLREKIGQIISELEEIKTPGEKEDLLNAILSAIEESLPEEMDATMYYTNDKAKIAHQSECYGFQKCLTQIKAILKESV